MQGSFFRQYRELEKYRPHKQYDTKYEKDCEEVLRAFSNPGQFDYVPQAKPIDPPKYHGKLVRAKEYTEKIHANRIKKEEEKRVHYQRAALARRTVEENNLTKEFAHSLKSFVDNRQSIPSKMIEESPAVKVITERMNSTTPYMPKIDLPPIIVSKKREITEEYTVFPKQNYMMVTQPMKYDRGKTDSKWTKEERGKLLSLYHQMNPPAKNAPNELLHLYLLSIAEKFLINFPERSKGEVMEKMRTMLRKKQLKEVGEEEYWQNLSKKPS